MAEQEKQEKGEERMPEEKDGAVVVEGERETIHCLSIIGQIEVSSPFEDWRKLYHTLSVAEHLCRIGVTESLPYVRRTLTSFQVVAA